MKYDPNMVYPRPHFPKYGELAVHLQKDAHDHGTSIATIMVVRLLEFYRGQGYSGKGTADLERGETNHQATSSSFQTQEEQARQQKVREIDVRADAFLEL